MDHIELIRTLRKRRRELEMTQKQLAQKINSSGSYLSLIERGKRNCDLRYFIEACKVLGLEIVISETKSEVEAWQSYDQT